MLAAAVAALSAAGCGGDNDDDTGGPDRAGTPAAQACSPKADQALKDAEFAMKSDDFDGALAMVKPHLECPRIKEREAQFRTRAARTTLRIARKHLATATREPGPENSPQAAVSLARNSLRYQETPEAQAFLKKAEAALAKFKEKYGPRPDEEPGGPPPGAGEGGPPEGKGGEE
jgi:acyl-CoA synthetase (NDP forming)